MVGYVKIIIALSVSFFIIQWAVINPGSASSIVDKVSTGFTACADFISENLFDKEEA